MDPITLLREMVEIESLSGSEGAVAAYIVGRMRELGYDEAFVDAAGNAVGIRRGQGTPSGESHHAGDLVLLGHMDTVPGRIPVRIEGGLLYGRGSVDAKGPLATFVMAGAQVTPPPGTRLVVIGATEEEAASSKGAHHAAGAYRPSACIIGEPSNWDAVTLGYKGRLLCDYRLEQGGAHSAGPETAAPELAIAAWNAIAAHAAAFNQGREHLFDQLMPSLRSIRSSSDGITDVVEMTMGFRLGPGFDTDALEAFIRAAAMQGLPEHARAQVRFRGREVAWQSTRTTPLAWAFNMALREAGVTPRFKVKTGTSDMNVVGPVWNCPIVAYGPGDSKLDHTPNEHLVIEEYLLAIGVLAGVLRGFLESTGT